MDQWYRSVISGERAGAWPAILRFGFEVMSWGYGLGIGVRNGLFDARILRVRKLPVPVISVGNITTGGTGKTPTVIMLVKELQRMGRRPAVLTRGYGAPKGGGKSDEVMVIEHECPDVPVIVNGDRVAGGKLAMEMHGADVLVMDDGFQHRRLFRDLNLVLVDATEPMGVPGVLPRGTWREPPFNLRRANMIMLTRCEQVSAPLADLAANLLTQWVEPRMIFKQKTTVSGVFDAAGNAVPLVVGGGRKVLAFAGVGNPNGFLHTVRSLGMNVSAASWFDDHHPYDASGADGGDFEDMLKLSKERGAEAWVTTLKDWVKLRNLKMPAEAPPVWHVRIEARLDASEQEILRARLGSVMAGKGISPQRHGGVEDARRGET